MNQRTSHELFGNDSTTSDSTDGILRHQKNPHGNKNKNDDTTTTTTNSDSTSGFSFF